MIVTMSLFEQRRDGCNASKASKQVVKGKTALFRGTILKKIIFSSNTESRKEISSYRYSS